jgi:hypothetical protein
MTFGRHDPFFASYLFYIFPRALNGVNARVEHSVPEKHVVTPHLMRGPATSTKKRDPVSSTG